MKPIQSALHPAGPLAGRIEDLWWFAFFVAAAVYVATMGALFWSLARARRREREGASIDDGAEQRMTKGVTWAAGATMTILLVFLGYDLVVGRTLSPIPKKQPITIDVVGKQWYWDVRYRDTTAHGYFSTANEIHIPVGEPVLFLLQANDVIHSLWVPNLAGKKDLIPGYTQSFWFQADSAGVYRGQCAEFCGLQHAKMALHIVAEPKETFQQWVLKQREAAHAPSDSVEGRGLEVFLTSSCAMCHNIEGTVATSRVGPDLTHLASRRMIAAGSLANTRENLRGWIINAQAFKPGSRMPPNVMNPKDLDALLTYLQSLK